MPRVCLKHSACILLLTLITVQCPPNPRSTGSSVALSLFFAVAAESQVRMIMVDDFGLLMLQHQSQSLTYRVLSTTQHTNAMKLSLQSVNLMARKMLWSLPNLLQR